MASIHRKKRSPYWQAYWRDERGHPHCRSTKQKTRREAQRIADAWELTAKRRRSAQHVRSVFAEVYRDVYGSELPSTTFREHASKWLNEKRIEASTASLRSYNTTVNHFLAHLGERADQDITTISREEIIVWRSSLAGRLFHVTTNRHIKTLRSIFKSAKRDGLILENPVDAVASVASSQTDRETGRRPFSLSEI